MKSNFLLIGLLTAGCLPALAINVNNGLTDTIPAKSNSLEIKGLQILNVTKDKLRTKNPDLPIILKPELLYIGIDNVFQVTASEPLKEIGASVENGSLTKVADNSFIVRVNAIAADFKIKFYIVSNMDKLFIQEMKYPVRAIPAIQKADR